MNKPKPNAKHHEVKLEIFYFTQVELGYKTFEIRENDRDYQAGDKITLKEFCKTHSYYTGRSISFTVGYVCDYKQIDNHVVFSLLDMQPLKRNFKQ